MYNLNGSTMNGPPILSVVDGVSSAGLTPGICTTTPRTPEILNSVIAMTNPLEYSFPSTTAGIVVQPKQSQVSAQSGFLVFFFLFGFLIFLKFLILKFL